MKYEAEKRKLERVAEDLRKTEKKIKVDMICANNNFRQRIAKVKAKVLKLIETKARGKRLSRPNRPKKWKYVAVY